MKDNGILVMGFLFAWEACKGAQSTVTVLITVQRKARNSPSLGSWQLGVQDKGSRSGRAVLPVSWEQRAGRNVLRAVCCIAGLHTRIQLWIFTVAWLPGTPNWQRDFLARARLKFIYPADFSEGVSHSARTVANPQAFSCRISPRLSFRLCVCPVLIFVLLSIFKIPPELSMVISDEKQVVRRLFKHLLLSWAVLL